MAPKMGANREEEKNETEKRHFQSASTCTPPRKRSISPQGGTIRCRNVAAGRSMTPENRGSSPTMQEKLARWPRVDSPEKEQLSQAWSMMEQEQGAISDTRDALLMEAGKGSSAMWKMKQESRRSRWA